MLDLTRTQPRFPLGRTVATPAVLAAGVNLQRLLWRHHRGDWGDLDHEDSALNEQALIDGGRILSAHQTPAGRIYIITEADRSSTCCLFASEY
jgi:hypothetical protein